jgi:hypothetical protein
MLIREDVVALGRRGGSWEGVVAQGRRGGSGKAWWLLGRRGGSTGRRGGSIGKAWWLNGSTSDCSPAVPGSNPAPPQPTADCQSSGGLPPGMALG